MSSIFKFLFCVWSLSFNIWLNAQVDFTNINMEVFPDVDQKAIRGKGSYIFELKTETDSIFLDAINIKFEEVELNGKPINFWNSGKRLGFKAPKKLGKHQLVVAYGTKPRQTVYFITSASLSDQNQINKNSSVTEETPSDRNEKMALSNLNQPLYNQVWTQGQGKYTSHWLPSFDDMNEKLEFDLTFHVPPKYTVISNGNLKNSTTVGNLKSWKFDMTRPMSSYLAAFVIGDFDKKVVQSKSGIPIELYYESKDSLRVEPTYRYTKEIFDFLEKEIGVAYPWQNYKQVPVQDFLYAGMENTTCTIFSNQYVIDSTAFVDKNYVNVNAHELAHQWFGNLVTEESGTHHWLHEGFATYYAYLAEKELFGRDHFYWKLYQTAKTLHNLSENGDGEALTNPNANSLTFYEKGAWALVMLKERVGEDAFKKGIKDYLRKYAFDNVTITDFLTEIENASGIDLTDFRETWLEAEEFPWEEAKNVLANESKSLKTYFKLSNSLKAYPERFDSLMRMWDSFESDNLKMELIKDFKSTFLEPSFIKRIKNESIKVRQALVLSIDSIPRQFKRDFESFLKDKSYITQEVALFKLWQAFPENRNAYLDALNGVHGLPHKNIRLLWLTLALVTPEYQAENKKLFYDELNGYTNSHFNFETRQLAFQYGYQIGALNDMSLRNLIKAGDHHIWQFKKSSRNLIREIHKSPEGEKRFKHIGSSLLEKERQLLNTILKP